MSDIQNANRNCFDAKIFFLAAFLRDKILKYNIEIEICDIRIFTDFVELTLL